MSDWVLVDNPALGKPRPLKAACHDKTPCIDVRCTCGYTMHIHESQIEEIPDDAEIGSRCKGCQELLVFPPGWFKRAFQILRTQGWVDE